jgi:hypothetical protein
VALDGPECPEELRYLWNWFQDISFARHHNGFNYQPLGWMDIYAWCRLFGRRLQLWEMRALIRLDREWLAAKAAAAPAAGNN